MELESRRGKRRRLTETIARRRRSDYVHLWLGGDASTSRCARTSINFWAKSGICGCACSKHHHGAPRRDKGMCDFGARSRIYRLRAQARELGYMVIRRGADPEGDDVARLSYGRHINDLW